MNINFSIKELLLHIDNVASCSIDLSLQVNRLSSLLNAKPNDLAIIFDRGDASSFDSISIQDIDKSEAGFFLASREIVPGKRYIIVNDVLIAFKQLISFLEKKSLTDQQTIIENNVLIHPSAVISSGVTIKSGSIIGAHVFIGKQSVIDNNVLLYPGVKILDRCIIGENSIIHAGAIIGSDGFGYEVTKKGLQKIPQIGIVRVGKDVEIGANCMIDRASFDETMIGNNVKIDNGTHIAHNVIIGAHTAILAQTGIAGSTIIGMGCQIGGQVAIKDHVKIGNNVKIVSKSAVMHDLKDGDIVSGIPAMPFGQWKRLTVSLNKLPDLIRSIQEIQKFKGAIKQPMRSWWQRFF